MSCASCQCRLPPSDALPTSIQTQELREFLRSRSILADPARYESEIASSTMALMHYDSEIQRLEGSIQTLKADRQRLQDYIDGCRAASAPIRRLAPEILCEIFGYIANPAPYIYISMHEALGTLGSLETLAKQDLLQLSQVCTLWHALIIGTPALWSQIGIIGIYWSGEHLKALKACLERGKHCLLTMILNPLDIQSEHLQPLMELLVHHCHRWLHLSLVMDPSRPDIFQAFKGRLHSLQQISLTLNSWEGGHASIDIFEDAPRLTQVYFTSDPWISGLPRLPWGQLRSFTCTDTGTYRFLDIMRNLAPNTAFTLHSHSFNPYEDPPHLPPITSHISSFSLEMAVVIDVHHSMQVLSAVLDCLTLPRLRQLSIDGHGANIWPADQFEFLSMRSSFHNTLHSLDLEGIHIAEDELLRSLTSLASLESLAIADQPAISVNGKMKKINLITNSLLLRLTWTPNSSDVCPIPRLTRLSCITRFKFNPRVFRDFLASRVALNGAPFEISIRATRPLSDAAESESGKQKAAVMRRLQPLIIAGDLRMISSPVPSEQFQSEEFY
ncbi:hypothetical protein GGX14DRAFT_699228 [Mycena pura]|uniref:F-box domain-containing protein n=1 Tax=Mycena pura TaxID=153505 RepID=A0AAD6Y6T8_9AGAR|nr:hypothetical protein GGX14DRAFT_699228 [Mycena pura]